MPISVTCGNCQAKLNAPDAAAGKRVKCPKCGTVIQIPVATPEYEVVEDAPPTPAVAKKPQIVNEDDRDEAPRKKKSLAVEDEEEKPRKKTARAVNEDEEDERPRKKKASAADAEGEDKPRRKKGRDESDEEDDDTPRKKKKKDRKEESSSKAGMIRLVIGLALLLILVPTAAAIFYFKFFANDDTAAATTKPGTDIPIVRPGPVVPGPIGPGPNPKPDPNPNPGPTPTTPDAGSKWERVDMPKLSADGTRVIGCVGSFASPEYLGEWETATGKKLGQFSVKNIKDLGIFRIAYSGARTQDSKVAAYASSAKKFIVWDAKTHAIEKEIPITLDGFDKAIQSVHFFAFTSDANALLVHGGHAVVRVDISSGKQEFIMAGKVEYDSGSFAAGVDTVVAYGNFKFPDKLRVTKLKSPDESEDIELSKGVGSSQQVVSADGSTVAMKTTDEETKASTIVLFDMKTKKVVDKVKMPGDYQKAFVKEFALSDDGSVLAILLEIGVALDRNNVIIVYTTKDKVPHLVPQQFKDVMHISLAGNGSRLAIGTLFKPLVVLDIATLR